MYKGSQMCSVAIVVNVHLICGHFLCAEHSRQSCESMYSVVICGQKFSQSVVIFHMQNDPGIFIKVCILWQLNCGQKVSMCVNEGSLQISSQCLGFSSVYEIGMDPKFLNYPYLNNFQKEMEFLNYSYTNRFLKEMEFSNH